jgi:cytochrome c biogenesis protein CcmG/thiol:disulfide interchange protein DsbE
MTNEHSSQETPNPADPAAEPSSAPAAAAGSDAPVPTRKRWIAAAAAALGVALFAVPFLRGPADRPSASNEHAELTIEKASGPSCAAKAAANLDFTLKDINGANIQLADYKGKVVLLNFWATWCGPCKLEIPEFVEAYERYRDKGFVILGVLSEDDPSPAVLRTFMTEFKMNYPVFREHQELAEANGELWALPTSILIDRHGSICTKHTGAMSKEMLEQEIKGLL